MPIFNNMRKSLIPAEGAKKYLLYAIGEILLVMIGILLALEVNNFNDERKDRALEKELLTGILIGLRSDSGDMAYNLGEHTKILKSRKIVLAWLYGTAPFSDTLKQHLARAHGFTVFTSIDGPYEMLKTSGPQLIQNREVRDKISKLYDNTYDIYGERERLYNTVALESFTRINASLFDGTTPYQFNTEFSTAEMEPYDATELRINKAFKHQIKTMMVFNEILVNISIAPSGRKVNQLIELVKKELEKK